MKTCSKCGVEKAVEMFPKRGALCRACENVQKKTWRDANLEKVRAGKKASHERHSAANNARSKAWYDANREEVLANQKARYISDPTPFAKQNVDYRKRNNERVTAKQREWYAGNRGRAAAKNKARYTAHPEVFAAYAIKRRIAQQYRTPLWLSPAHRDQIASIYRLRDELTKTTGVLHHVDHICPLRGDNVSGLHVPWNLRVIPAFDNLSKSNRYEGPDSWAA